MLKVNPPIFEHAQKKYTSLDIQAALKSAGVQVGDTLMVHSDLKAFGKLIPGVGRQDFLDAFLTALFETVGPKGHLILPTFSYSFCKKKDFDPEETPSTVGILTEAFRKLPGVARSLDPIFSVAVSGPDKEFFTQVGCNCFGPQCIFEKLYERKGKLLLLGETFDITFIHFVEQRLGITYRYIKPFSGNVKVGAALQPCTMDYLVRHMDKDVCYDMEVIAGRLSKAGIVTQVPLGASRIRCLETEKTFATISEGMKTDPFFLLAHPAKL